MSNSNKSILIICQQPALGSDHALAALDVAMSFAAFEQDVSLLFKDHGVWQLLAGQDSAAHQHKRLPNIMQSFELYGLSAVYAEQQALQARGISMDNCSIKVEPVDAAAMTALIQRHDSVMVF